MKKLLLIILCAAMTLSLCSCAGEAAKSETVTVTPEAQTPSPTAEPTAEPTPEPTPEIDIQAEEEALRALLTEIDEESRPGTSGGSLTAARIASDTLNWAIATKLNEEQISQLTLQWMADMEYGDQSEFNIKMDSVYYSYQCLIAPDSAGLMESAGLNYPEGNWGYEPIPAVEAIESAVGPSDMDY